MPYAWRETDAATELRLWPHRSLPRRGFVWFIGVTAALLSLPLLMMLGSTVMWGLLPFMLAAIAAVWIALERSYRDGALTEILRLSGDVITLEHRPVNAPAQHWQANPFWVRVQLHATAGPVEKYLTLSGNGREVELGRFLSAEERETLAGDLRSRLERLKLEAAEF